MIGHVFKLVWNRKRSNAWIAAEILAAFLVLFAVVTWGVQLLELYRRPLGYDIERVWLVYISYTTGTKDERQTNMQQMLETIKELDGVEAVAMATLETVPYSGGNANSTFDHKERTIRMATGRGTDGMKAVLGIKMMQGRWFEPADDALDWTPVVVNERLAHDLFGKENPIGQFYGEKRDSRVVGVMLDYRKKGEFSSEENFMIRRIPSSKLNSHGAFILKVRSGMARAFEETLVKKLGEIGKGWVFQVMPLSEMRRNAFKESLIPIAIAGTICVFLIAMVALGLLGVLWQMVTQRYEEIGLRRAQGATAKMILRQILGEVLAIATLGIGVGVLLVVQVPLLGFASFLNGGVFVTSLAVSVAMMYLLAVLCGWYPGRLATRVHPVEALHYE